MNVNLHRVSALASMFGWLPQSWQKYCHSSSQIDARRYEFSDATDIQCSYDIDKKRLFACFTITMCLTVCPWTSQAVPLSAFVSQQSWVADCHFQLQPEALQTRNQYSTFSFWWTHTGDRQIPLIKTALDWAPLRLLMWLMDCHRQLYRKSRCDLLWQSLADSKEVHLRKSGLFVFSSC